MTDLLKQSLEALELLYPWSPESVLFLDDWHKKVRGLLPKLRAAIEQGSQGFAEWMHQYEHWLKAKGYNLPLGCRDHAAVAYLAGQQSAAQRITELEAEVQNLKETTR